NDPKMGRDVDMLATGDVVLGALLFLQEQFENMGLIALRPRLTLDRNQRRLVFGVVPESLLAALWLQFALAADGDRKFQRCPACGRWFELAPQVNRADRLTCSSSCRTRAYLQRKERARQMYVKGNSIKDIARELDSDAKTVKRWVTRRKNK